MPAEARPDQSLLSALRAALERAADCARRDSASAAAPLRSAAAPPRFAVAPPRFAAAPPRSAAAPPRFAVALSGGLDSSLLLAALARLEPVPIFRALHVDHGLHPDSADWDAHCAAFAASLGVPYRSVRVDVDRSQGIGVEAAAREARYAALAALLEPGEILLTAHHADDVLETILHRLVRGTGIRGLRAVLPHARLGPGFIARPLLELKRAELRLVAEGWGIEWLEDPSNRSLDYDRNYLRAEVLPALERRWPHAAKAAVRLAAAASDAEEILAAAAEADLASAAKGGRHPSAAALAQLSPARRRNALRHAVASSGLPMPGARQLETLAASLLSARPEARTRVSWPGAEARIHRGRLYLLAAPAPEATPSQGATPSPAAPTSSAPREERGGPAGAHRDVLTPAQPWVGAAGRLTLEPEDPSESATEAGEGAGLLPDAVVREGLEVRFRRGGERFKPAGGAHHRKLKHWFQEQGIVPWMRDRVPLLYWRGRLVAIADLAVCADLPPCGPEARAWRVRWDNHPPIR